MTLIASIVCNKVPLLLGDLLATTDNNISSYIAIPSSNDINNLLAATGSRKVVRLVQKINLLSDNLCVAVAGDASQARNLIEVLSHLTNVDHLTKELVDRTIDSIQLSDRDKISHIVFFIQHDPAPSNGFVVITRKSKDIELSEQYHGVFTGRAGTGEGAFDDLLKTFDWSALETLRNGGIGVVQAANFIAQLFACQFTGIEYMSGQNLSDSWGGGIEIVTVHGNRLIKIGNVVHLFCLLVVDEETGQYAICMRTKFVKYEYFEDLLLIRVLEVKGAIEAQSTVDNVFAVTPVLKTRKDYDSTAISTPDFSCTSICLHIESPEHKRHINSVFQDPEGIEGLVIENTGGNFLFELSKELREQIENVASSEIGEAVKFTFMESAI